MRIKLKRAQTETAEMDITPMIDCTFLLLIFFILTSKMDASKLLELPPAKYGAAAVEKNCVIIVVTKGEGGAGKVYLSDMPDESKLVRGSPEDQEKAVMDYITQEIRANPHKKEVIIKASMGVKHREVARVTKAAARIEDVNVEQLYVGIMQQQ
jgi:biopolymer transport protein ExbD